MPPAPLPPPVSPPRAPPRPPLSPQQRGCRRADTLTLTLTQPLTSPSHSFLSHSFGLLHFQSSLEVEKGRGVARMPPAPLPPPVSPPRPPPRPPLSPQQRGCRRADTLTLTLTQTLTSPSHSFLSHSFGLLHFQSSLEVEKGRGVARMPPAPLPPPVSPPRPPPRPPLSPQQRGCRRADTLTLTLTQPLTSPSHSFLSHSFGLLHFQSSLEVKKGRGWLECHRRRCRHRCHRPARRRGRRSRPNRGDADAPTLSRSLSPRLSHLHLTLFSLTLLVCCIFSLVWR